MALVLVEISSSVACHGPLLLLCSDLAITTTIRRWLHHFLFRITTSIQHPWSRQVQAALVSPARSEAFARSIEAASAFAWTVAW